MVKMDLSGAVVLSQIVQYRPINYGYGAQLTVEAIGYSAQPQTARAE